MASVLAKSPDLVSSSKCWVDVRWCLSTADFGVILDFA